MGADKRVRLDQITLLGMQCGKPSKNENKPNPIPLIRDALYHCKIWAGFLLVSRHSSITASISFVSSIRKQVRSQGPDFVVFDDLQETANATSTVDGTCGFAGNAMEPWFLPFCFGFPPEITHGS